MGDSATSTPARYRSLFPAGDANPGSRRSRLILRREYKAVLAERDALQARLDAFQARLDAVVAACFDIKATGAAVTAAEMQKVLVQRPELDSPIDQIFRQWLTKKPGEYFACLAKKERIERGDAMLRERVKKLEAENAKLRRETGGRSRWEY